MLVRGSCACAPVRGRICVRARLLCSQNILVEFSVLHCRFPLGMVVVLNSVRNAVKFHTPSIYFAQNDVAARGNDGTFM